MRAILLLGGGHDAGGNDDGPGVDVLDHVVHVVSHRQAGDPVARAAFDRDAGVEALDRASPLHLDVADAVEQDADLLHLPLGPDTT